VLKQKITQPKYGSIRAHRPIFFFFSSPNQKFLGFFGAASFSRHTASNFSSHLRFLLTFVSIKVCSLLMTLNIKSDRNLELGLAAAGSAISGGFFSFRNTKKKNVIGISIFTRRELALSISFHPTTYGFF
jgi:hypothetical protein